MLSLHVVGSLDASLLRQRARRIGRNALRRCTRPLRHSLTSCGESATDGFDAQPNLRPRGPTPPMPRSPAPEPG